VAPAIKKKKKIVQKLTSYSNIKSAPAVAFAGFNTKSKKYTEDHQYINAKEFARTELN
jgi:hypothetical protein